MCWRGCWVAFNSPLGKWLYVKVILALLIVIIYSAFLWQSHKKPQYLQEDPKVITWCLTTQTLGFLLVSLVFYPHVLARLG